MARITAAPSNFYLRLIMSLIASFALMYVFYLGLKWWRWPEIELPPILFLLISFLPFLYFLYKTIRRKEFFSPVRYLRLAALVVFSSALTAGSFIFAVIPPNIECQGQLGEGLLAGEVVIAAGLCVTWFHEYEEYIELYPRHWNWIGGKSSGERVALISPSHLGVEINTEDESLAFPSKPLRVEFDGTSAVTILFRNGEKQKVTPDFDHR